MERRTGEWLVAGKMNDIQGETEVLTCACRLAFFILTKTATMRGTNNFIANYWLKW